MLWATNSTARYKSPIPRVGKMRFAPRSPRSFEIENVRVELAGDCLDIFYTLFPSVASFVGVEAVGVVDSYSVAFVRFLSRASRSSRGPKKIYLRHGMEGASPSLLLLVLVLLLLLLMIPLV